jgi:DNA-binding NarL/FixJ family response regulator
MARIRVLLVDDHGVVRHGLRRLLELDTEIQVAGEAADGREALKIAAEGRIDVALVDLGLPELNGVEVTRRLRSRSPRTRVIILSMHTDEDSIRQAVRAGAGGYLVKDVDYEDVVTAVKAVHRGGSFFSPGVAKTLLEGLGTPGARTESDERPLDSLTTREREVLQLIAEGKTNKQMCTLLGISLNTVETHRKHLMEKLGLHRTADLVRFAIAQNIVR